MIKINLFSRFDHNLKFYNLSKTVRTSGSQVWKIEWNLIKTSIGLYLGFYYKKKLFSNSCWNKTAFVNFHFEINIKVKWERLTTNYLLVESITPSYIIRLIQFSFRSLNKFTKSNFESSQSFSLSERNVREKIDHFWKFMR